MSRPSRLRSLVLALALAAGCGGGDGEEGLAELVGRVDADGVRVVEVTALGEGGAPVVLDATAPRPDGRFTLQVPDGAGPVLVRVLDDDDLHLHGALLGPVGNDVGFVPPLDDETFAEARLYRLLHDQGTPIDAADLRGRIGAPTAAALAAVDPVERERDRAVLAEGIAGAWTSEAELLELVEEPPPSPDALRAAWDGPTRRFDEGLYLGDDRALLDDVRLDDVDLALDGLGVDVHDRMLLALHAGALERALLAEALEEGPLLEARLVETARREGRQLGRSLVDVLARAGASERALAPVHRLADRLEADLWHAADGEAVDLALDRFTTELLQGDGQEALLAFVGDLPDGAADERAARLAGLVQAEGRALDERLQVEVVAAPDPEDGARRVREAVGDLRYRLEIALAEGELPHDPLLVEVLTRLAAVGAPFRERNLVAADP